MRELLAEVNAALDRRRPCVYCAVVETRGSTPQKPGAAMLVFPDGGQVGTLGGGCVEAEVKQRALQALHDGGRPRGSADISSRRHPRMGRRPDLRRPDDHPPGPPARRTDRPPTITAGCTALAERGQRLHRGRRRRRRRRPGAPATDTSSTPTAPSRPRAGQSLRAVAGEPAPLSARPRPATRHGVAYLPTLPRVTVFLIGGGHVGQATARFAAEVGFEIWVLDDREQYVTPERFPSASRRIVGDVGPTLAELTPVADAERLRPDPDARPPARRGGPVPAGVVRVRLRRHDRQPSQDQIDL